MQKVIFCIYKLNTVFYYWTSCIYFGFHDAPLISDTFVVLKHVYIPLLFFSGVDYIDAPTPYMMGLHSGVDISNLVMDGVSLIYYYMYIFYVWDYLKPWCKFY